MAAPGGLTIGAGGAIVAGSEPEAELEEMLLKARPLLEAVGGTLDAGAPAPIAGAESRSSAGDATSTRSGRSRGLSLPARRRC